MVYGQEGRSVSSADDFPSSPCGVRISASSGLLAVVAAVAFRLSEPGASFQIDPTVLSTTGDAFSSPFNSVTPPKGLLIALLTTADRTGWFGCWLSCGNSSRDGVDAGDGGAYLCGVATVWRSSNGQVPARSCGMPP